MRTTLGLARGVVSDRPSRIEIYGGQFGLLRKELNDLPDRLADQKVSSPKRWDRLRLDRGLAMGDGWEHYPEVEIRANLLERALKGSQAAGTWDDVQARFDWKRYEFSRQWLDPQELDDPFIDRLEADIIALRRQPSTMDTPHRDRTTADKRAAVLSMLDTHPELTDREIARRLNVSPTTVGTLRRKAA